MSGSSKSSFRTSAPGCRTRRARDEAQRGSAGDAEAGGWPCGAWRGGVRGRSMQSVLRAARAADDRVLVNVAWRKPRAVDFRAVQFAVAADGAGNLLSGLVGTVPNATCSTSIAITDLAGDAARSVGGWIEVRRSPAARTRSPPVRCLRAGRPRPGTNGRRIPARASTCPLSGSSPVGGEMLRQAICRSVQSPEFRIRHPTCGSCRRSARSSAAGGGDQRILSGRPARVTGVADRRARRGTQA